MTPVSQLGVVGFVLFWGITAIAFGLFSRRIYQLSRFLFLGRREEKFGHTIKRIFVTIGHVIGQWSQFKNLSLKDRSGLGHVFMAWGFLTFILYYLLFIIIGTGFNVLHVLEENAFYVYYTWIMDIAAPLIMLAALWGIIRRYIVKPARLQGQQTAEAMIILVSVFIHPVTHLFKIGTSIAMGHPPAGLGIASPPISAAISQLYTNPVSIEAWHSFWFWIHWGVVLFVLVYIGYSRYLHMVVAPFNIFLRAVSGTRPKGALSIIDLENVETFGASRITDFTWKQLLDLYSCVSCGRCQDACPAYASGKPLNPKDLIQDLKKHLLAVGPALLKNGGEAGPLIGDVISEETLWSCTMCRSCMEQCPVANEHLEKIVDMRRSLVMEQAQMPEPAMVVLKSIENRGHPWRGTTSTRTEWASGLDVKVLSEDSNVDIVYWVGCTAALDARCQKIAIAMANILRAAGVNFGILGEEESCCGEPARSIGNEYLFQIQAMRNIETLNRYNVKKIVTTCPHGFNSLKNEYPQLGANFDVVHHTQFMAELIRDGKLKLTKDVAKKATYHDPCQLGRYNEIYNEPREVLASVPSLKITEMDNKMRNSFCCGGGGGRSWMEESGVKISHLRVDDAVKTEAETIVTACPFCMMMFEDALKAKGIEEKLSVIDIAELVNQSM